MKNKIVLLFFLLLSPVVMQAQSGWYNYSSQMIQAFSRNDFNSAASYGELALKSAEEEFGKRDSIYALTAELLGKVYNITGQYKKAEPLFLEMKNLIKEIWGEKHPQYATVIGNLSELYRNLGQDGKAEPYLIEAMRIDKETLGENNVFYATDLNNLAALYHQLGKYDESVSMFEDAASRMKNIKGENSSEYSLVLNGLAAVYHTSGEYSKAEKFYTKALEIRKEVLGTKSPEYAITLMNLAILYADLGRYENAEKYALEAKDIYRSIYGNNHQSYALCLSNLATIYSMMKRYNMSGPIFEESIEVYKNSVGEKHPKYANALLNSALMYYDQGQYQKAEEITLKAYRILKETSGENSVDYTATLNNLGVIYLKMGKFGESEKYNLEALKIRDRLLGKYHPFFALSAMNLATCYYAMKKYDDAEMYFSAMNESYMKQISSYFPSLSEKEKLEFLNTFEDAFDKYYSFSIDRYNRNPAIAGNMLNLRLSAKGLILSSTVQMKNRIFENGDNNLIELYNRWIAVSKDIAKAYSLSAEERLNREINLENLESEANEIEKQLGEKSEIFKNEKEKKSFKWEDIKNSLKSDEAAVEFVDFRYYDKSQTDRVIYCALVIRKEYEFPKLVTLCEEKDLSGLINVSSDNNDNYVKNSVKGLSLYNLIWNPIDVYLKGSISVYISVSGLLNKVSFLSLTTGDKGLLCDKYLIRYMSNLKDIVNKTENSIDKNKFTADIFGGIKYDLNETEMQENSLKFRGADEEWSPPVDVVMIDAPGNKIGKWAYLPGTLKEADYVSNIFEKNSLKVKEFAGELANEEAFKSLNFKNSPTLLHVSTHGYFFPEHEKGNPEIKGNTFKISDNPLFRSGLILAGANWVWTGGNEIEGVENGILTAYEVSNMDLVNTDLVVLSACETGLGDIKGGEGVYGLQRAFKVAGAKTIIMSLWKVPDKETVELMELFYTNWLGGMTKQYAFTSAQIEMRKKYAPYFWAAFVMVE
jgi:CHAT domain-containing protein/tetratricopeptide (TPR) repeat protein